MFNWLDISPLVGKLFNIIIITMELGFLGVLLPIVLGIVLIVLREITLAVINYGKEDK